jgi:poly(hydroxyalkanoate) depolymerase family esterase
MDLGNKVNRPNMKSIAAVALSLLLVVTVFQSFTSKTSAAGQFLTETYNYKNYKVYVPGGYVSGTAVPMVVMLHGCTQDPDQFSKGTKMNSIAERDNFIVVYPDQPSSENQNKCWRWFLSGHQSSGSGDPAHIAGITAEVKKDYSIDNDRVYVTGLSAGAAMSVIMGATYPDVYAAIGVGAGLEYKAATSESAAWNAMSNGGPDPVQQGNAAYKAMGSNARVVPTIVFHGTSDYTVYPVNGHQIISQWAQSNDLASDGSDNGNIDDNPEKTTTGQVKDGRSYTQYIYKDSTNGSIVMEKYMVDGMGHAWSGGDAAGSYTDPKGPDASEITWQFFKAHAKSGPDTIAPTTTATPVGGTYEGSVTVELKADEPVTTYYTADGSTPTKSSPTYSGAMKLTGSTTLKFFSVDKAGNEEAIKSETYTITGDVTAATTVADPASGTFNSSVDVQLSTNEPATIYYTTDGTTPTTSSPTYSGAFTFTTDTTLKFFSVDGSGNQEDTNTESYAISKLTTVSLPSIAAEDGFAGYLSADGLSSTVHKLGDKGMGNSDTYRTILSFDTSVIPDNSGIDSAVLRIYRKSLTGTINGINIDIKKGFFGGNSGLEQVDYNNTASSTDIASIEVPSSDNEYTEVSLSSSAFDFIDKMGKTQFRLKGSAAADIASDVLEIYGGDNSTYAPQLIVTYGETADTTAPTTSATPAGGSYSEAQSVTLSLDEPGTTYYTTDGSTPTTSSTKYTEGITISASTTLKFFSVDVAGNTESVKTESYEITGDTTAPTTIATPAGGSYENSVTVELAANEPATTYYTTDGSTPTTSSTKYSGGIKLTSDTSLKFFSVDSAGNTEGVKVESYDIRVFTEITFKGFAIEDGFVGMYLADGISSTVHKAGDKGMSNLDTYRSILSFDTSALDDNATVASAKLRIYRKTLSGTINSLSLSMIRGHWSTSSELEQSDYGATVSANPANGALDFATMAVPESNNAYTEISLPTSALEFVSKNGRTQFRLKASTPADFYSDILEIYGGEDSTYAPQLIVTTY